MLAGSWYAVRVHVGKDPKENPGCEAPQKTIRFVHACKQPSSQVRVMHPAWCRHEPQGQSAVGAEPRCVPQHHWGTGLEGEMARVVPWHYAPGSSTTGRLGELLSKRHCRPPTAGGLLPSVLHEGKRACTQCRTVAPVAPVARSGPATPVGRPRMWLRVATVAHTFMSCTRLQVFSSYRVTITKSCTKQAHGLRPGALPLLAANRAL